MIQAAILTLNAARAALLSEEGELSVLDHKAAQKAIEGKSVIVCHAPYTAARLDFSAFHPLDVLELFAFVHPARFTVPTPVGLTRALGLSPPKDFEDWPLSLMECVGALLNDIKTDKWAARADPAKITGVMGLNGRGWGWTPHIFTALGQKYNPADTIVGKADLNVWRALPEWSEEAPPPPPDHFPVSADEAKERLGEILGPGAEQRGEQMDYAATIAKVFEPVSPPYPPASGGEDASASGGEVRAVMAEAGTGVGKTLGYLAPASVWADKNKSAVWISTYTKNLQRQLDQELSRLYPDEDLKAQKVAIRKGRENYLCLLNFEDLATGSSLAKDARQAVAAGIMARWAAATNDGDMQGGDFPGWLSGLLGYHYTYGQADRRGECIYSACDHYHRCFVERSVRKSKHASLVVANHALVMINAALSSGDDEMPSRYIFDEGHHLFDAADSAFAGHLTAREGQDLRRWIRGPEGGKKSRARGLKKRAEDICAEQPELEALLEECLEQARVLSSDGWQGRLKKSEPRGPMEEFLSGLYVQVISRADGANGPYSMETPTRPLGDGLVERGLQLKKALTSLQTPMKQLAQGLRKKLNDQADTLDSDTRKRLDSVAAALERRAQMTLGAWVDMLDSLSEHPAKNNKVPAFAGTTNPLSDDNGFVDWLALERMEGKAYDLGLYRHHVNPMEPFANSMKPHAHGIAVTSATLRDKSGDPDKDWQEAGQRTGLNYLARNVIHDYFPSPFNYAEQTKVIVIEDVNKMDDDQVASAYRSLFQAANGGALGLFTAISRLRSVHDKIAAKLEENHLSLYAQHIDAMDNGTLVDIFRDDVNACLLGTDAVRDGVDVPGESLRLIVFDRVPWPRPTILHKARREAFGGRSYDEMLTRLRLKQAYGRLIRRQGDKGLFIMLDSALPSRLHSAFPDGVAVERMGLANACESVRNFLAKSANSRHKAA